MPDTRDKARVPPQNLEAEESVLGAILLSERALDACLDEHLTGDDFYRESHGVIFSTAVAMYSMGEPVDAVTLAAQLERDNNLDRVGGTAKIAELAAIVPATANAGHYAKIVKEQAFLRGLLRAGQEIQRLGMDHPGDTHELLDRAEGLIFDLAGERQSQEYVGISDTVKESYARIMELYETGKKVTGLETGFHRLDALTSGFQKGNLIVIAARPSMGKTALAMAMAANVAIHQGIPVAVFTMEMNRAEITDRVLSQEALIDSSKIRNGNLDGEDWKRLQATTAKIEAARLLIDDSPMLTSVELRSKARRIKLRYPSLGLIVVDYLQLMTSGGKAENRVQDVSQISRTLKILARELDVPVIALSQLSRAVEQRHDKRPILSDLRESGSIEQDADLVAFVYRDEYYNPEDTDQEGIAEVNVAKHRNGRTDMVKVAFVKRYVRFSELPPDRGNR